MAGEFSDQAQRLLRDEIIRRFGFDPGKDNTNEAVLSLCTENRFDSLIDHLHSLPPWDGQPRLDSWLVDYLDADDNAYTRAAGAAWLTAAVVRAFDPGAKFDHMLVLRGAQGVGKSTALRILAGGADLFSDAAFLHAKDAREILEVTAGVWILECAELDGMRKKDIETLKAAISRQADKGRPAYARSAVTVPRRFVLAGTTNEERFLHDPTGNRRFWPVAVGNVDMERLQADRDQIIAEALHRYRSGNYSLVLEGDAAEGAAAAQQQGRYVDDGYRELLEGFEECGQKWNGHWIVRSDAVYDQLGIPKERRSGNVPQKVSAVMKDLGWVRHDKTVRLDGEPCRIYIWQGEPPEKPF
jgi:predicted P-loop ATPase